MTAERPFDVVVAGAGPSGLAATAALCGEGLRVLCANPVQPPRWPNTYGIWLDELQAVELEQAAAKSWTSPRVELEGSRTHRLDRAYACIDNEKLRDALIARSEAGDVTWREATVESVHRDDDGVVVETRDGDSLRATLSVDATGHDPVLVERAESSNPGYQTAYGVVGACRPPPCGPEEMLLMDFRTDHLRESERDEAPPSFLYAMELEDDRYLLEETTLVARPKVATERLERRLHRRLEHRGHEIDVDTFERVEIPMGHELPRPSDRVVPFGGAASMVHPATGFMVGRALQAAGPMAEAVASALRDPGVDNPSREAVARGWRAIHPTSLRRARELLVFGMETLLTLDARQTADFFDAFFSLGAPEWSDYMSGRVSAARLAGIMWRLFGWLDLDLKGRLARLACSAPGAHLVRSLTA